MPECYNPNSNLIHLVTPGRLAQFATGLGQCDRDSRDSPSTKSTGLPREWGLCLELVQGSGWSGVLCSACSAKRWMPVYDYCLISLLDLYCLYYESANNDQDTGCFAWLNRREFQFRRSCTWIHLWLLCDVELNVLWGWVGWGWVRFTVVNSWCNEVWN